jgi:hypothetical protein
VARTAYWVLREEAATTPGRAGESRPRGAGMTASRTSRVTGRGVPARDVPARSGSTRSAPAGTSGRQPAGRGAAAVPSFPRRPARRAVGAGDGIGGPGEREPIRPVFAKGGARRASRVGAKSVGTGARAGRPASAVVAGGSPAGSAAATRAGKGRGATRRPVPDVVTEELRVVSGTKVAAHLAPRLSDAARAYEADRYREAIAILRGLVRIAPDAPSVRELYGLSLYRIGRWKDALRELRAFQELTASLDQHPVAADCERALGRHDRVEELWAELRRTGVSSDLLAEGRLVMAGSLADRGEIARAIELLAPAASSDLRHPEMRHVRQWYALADLYERAGDLPQARELFRRVVRADAELSDAPERLAGLR